MTMRNQSSMIRPDQLCPCGSKISAKSCCLPYLDGTDLPQTAEALMRSRYVAYTQQDTHYLLETWHPTTRPAQLSFDPSDDTMWIGLQVLGKSGGGAAEMLGTVSFEARYFTEGWIATLAECSRFERVEGKWRYLDGELDPTKTKLKVGRNDPCPCGSGKKFKRCCGR